MSTRGVIARTAGAEGRFKGIYNHSDSYPTWMGPHLWSMLYKQFKGDLAAMLRYVINQHSAGWSVLGTECFCHPKRDRAPEGANWYTDRDIESGSDIEWVWVFDEENNKLFVRDHQHDTDVAIVDLAGPEPDWKIMECGENFERCTHMAWFHFPELGDSPLSTQTYLGKRELEMRNAVAVIVSGKRYQTTGSGGQSDFINRYSGTSWPNDLWIATVKAGSKSKEIPIAYIDKAGYRPYRGVTWVFPPTKDNPNETLRS